MTNLSEQSPMFDESLGQELPKTQYDSNGMPTGYQWQGGISGAMVRGDQNLVKGSSMETESTQLRDETSATDMNLYYGRVRDFIGTPIDIDVNQEGASEAVLNKAGLNWPVYTQDGLEGNWEFANKRTPRQIYRLIPDKMVDADGQPTTNHEQADHNLSTKKLFTTAVSTRWKPVQNSSLVDDIVRFCKESSTQIERVGTLADETKVFAVLNVGDEFVLRNEDRTTAKMIVSNTHCPGGLDFRLMALRQVCTNTLVNPVRIKTKKLTHVSNITSAHIMAVMRGVRDEFTGFHQGAELTSQVPSTLSALGQMEGYHDRVARVRAFALEKFGVKQTDGAPKALADQPLWLRDMIQNDQHLLASIVAISAVKVTNRKDFHDDTAFDTLPQMYRDIMSIYQKETLSTSFNTVWGAFNGVTGHVDHFMSTRNGDAGHFQSAWFGPKARAKQAAFATAQQVAVLALG